MGGRNTYQEQSYPNYSLVLKAWGTSWISSMVSPLTVQRLKVTYPSGVKADNVVPLVAELYNSIRTYNPGADMRTLRADVYNTIAAVGTSMDDWFVMYIIHSITAFLDDIESGDIKVRRPSFFKRLCR